MKEPTKKDIANESKEVKVKRECNICDGYGYTNDHEEYERGFPPMCIGCGGRGWYYDTRSQ